MWCTEVAVGALLISLSVVSSDIADVRFECPV